MLRAPGLHRKYLTQFTIEPSGDRITVVLKKENWSRYFSMVIL